MAITMPPNVKRASSSERAAEAFISAAGSAVQTKMPATPVENGKAVVNMRFDTALLARIDAAARRQGISRTAWLHVAASRALAE